MPRKSSANSEPPQRTAKKAKLTDAERHKRFVETAEKLGADKDAGALDRALKKIAPLKG